MTPHIKRSRISLIHALIIYSVAVLAASAFTGCGTRGDPRPPAEDRTLETGEAENSNVPGHGNVDEEPDTGGTAVPEIPDPPGGLTALYTGSRIVITWNEVTGAVKYRIYRATGDSFDLIAETVTPAFTDERVKKGMKYSYRVTAVGRKEGRPSEEITVLTGDR
jgi:hypothetical protein